MSSPVFCLSRSSVDGLPGSMIRIRIFSQRQKWLLWVSRCSSFPVEILANNRLAISSVSSFIVFLLVIPSAFDSLLSKFWVGRWSEKFLGNLPIVSVGNPPGFGVWPSFCLEIGAFLLLVDLLKLSFAIFMVNTISDNLQTSLGLLLVRFRCFLFHLRRKVKIPITLSSLLARSHYLGLVKIVFIHSQEFVFSKNRKFLQKPIRRLTVPPLRP